MLQLHRQGIHRGQMIHARTQQQLCSTQHDAASHKTQLLQGQCIALITEITDQLVPHSPVAVCCPQRGSLALQCVNDEKALIEQFGEVKLHEVSDDVSHIAALCLEHPGYDLMVKFRQFGVYRYGADLLAQFGVDDEVLKNFENGSLEFDFEANASTYGLMVWLGEKFLTSNY